MLDATNCTRIVSHDFLATLVAEVRADREAKCHAFGRQPHDHRVCQDTSTCGTLKIRMRDFVNFRSGLHYSQENICFSCGISLQVRLIFFPLVCI